MSEAEEGRDLRPTKGPVLIQDVERGAELRSFFIEGAGNRVFDFSSTSFLSTHVWAPDIIL